MKTQGKLWTVCIVAIVTIIFGSWAWYHSASSAWMSTVTQNEKNAILYAENSLQLMMAQSNGHLNRTIETLAMHSVDLAQEMVDLIASDFGDTCLYVCLYDFDGKRIAAKGENIPEGFENSSFFETMRYSDGRALSESSLHSGTLHIQTASLLADGSAVLVGQDILPFYLTGLKSILGRDFWFYYGNDEQFDSVSVPPVSEPVYPKDYEEKFRSSSKNGEGLSRPSGHANFSTHFARSVSYQRPLFCTVYQEPASSSSGHPAGAALFMNQRNRCIAVVAAWNRDSNQRAPPVLERSPGPTGRCSG